MNLFCRAGIRNAIVSVSKDFYSAGKYENIFILFYAIIIFESDKSRVKWPDNNSKTNIRMVANQLQIWSGS